MQHPLYSQRLDNLLSGLEQKSYLQSRMSCKLTTAHRCRGAVSGSITSLEKQLIKLETLAEAAELSTADKLALKQIQQRLENLESSFRSVHFEALDLIEEMN